MFASVHYSCTKKSAYGRNPTAGRKLYITKPAVACLLQPSRQPRFFWPSYIFFKKRYNSKTVRDRDKVKMDH